MVFSFTMFPPVLVSFIYSDGVVAPFILGFALTFILGLVIWLPVRAYVRELRLRDGFFIVVMFWTVLGTVGALPFMLSETPHMSLADAMFESFSGLTTTGATVIVGIDNLPPSILFYRQQLQWLGGMGIIVLAVAILPMLGIGGMQLYRAETPGPMKDNKLTPRITETAKALWYIYLGLTIACALAYWLAGMSGFDAIAHSFSTIAIGGFSTHDASIGYFDSHLIETVAVVFMLLAGINFALHFIAWRSFSVMVYIRDPEARAYLIILSTLSFLTVSYLYATGTLSSLSDAMYDGIFHAVLFLLERQRGLQRRNTITGLAFYPFYCCLPVSWAGVPALQEAAA